MTCEKQTHAVKVALVGDTQVGKSSIVDQWLRQHFSQYTKSTIGAAFYSRTLADLDCHVKLQIWDTAGQEKYHSLAPMYYRRATVIIVVYDVTQRESFERAKMWHKEVLRGEAGALIALVGNKLDRQEERAVEREEAQQYAQQNDLCFLEVSAKANVNIEQLFVIVSHLVHEQEIERYIDDAMEVRL